MNIAISNRIPPRFELATDAYVGLVYVVLYIHINQLNVTTVPTHSCYPKEDRWKLSLVLLRRKSAVIIIVFLAYRTHLPSM